LFTSSRTYSCSASHEPEQPMFWLRLPVSSTVPGSTVCQQVPWNGTTWLTTSLTLVEKVTQSSPASASFTTWDRVRRSRSGFMSEA
jgi:hypothetical protein